VTSRPGPTRTARRQRQGTSAAIELATTNATSGKRSLKITFAGAAGPTITTTRYRRLDAYQTFKADVTVKPALPGRLSPCAGKKHARRRLGRNGQSLDQNRIPDQARNLVTALTIPTLFH